MIRLRAVIFFCSNKDCVSKLWNGNHGEEDCMPVAYADIIDLSQISCIGARFGPLGDLIVVSLK